MANLPTVTPPARRRLPTNALALALMIFSYASLQGCGGGADTQPKPTDPPGGDTVAPSVPVDVVATAASHDRIDLTWGASTDSGGSGLSGYLIYRNGSTTALTTVSAPATTYADIGLSANTQYSYVVRAIDGATNQSAASSAATATTQANPSTTDTAPPTVPTSLAAAAASNSRIDLTWGVSTDNSGGSGLAGYRLYRDGAATALTTVAAPATTYSDNGLAANTQYSYVVRAVDEAGNESTSSTAAVATTLATAPPGTPGLDTRPSNSTCLAWDRPTGGSVSLQRFTDLSFNAAVALLQMPGNSTRWFVVEQGGIVKQFTTPNPATATTFIDISARVAGPGDSPDPGSEMGLLGMAFHPDFPTDPRVFLSYTAIDGRRLSRISAFRTTDGGATLDASTEQVLMTVNQPEYNHNGGNIAFGPDGYLYIGFGDGGGSGDAHGDNGNGQRLTTLLGKMLRIDVDGATPYEVPATNPFYDAANATDTCPAAGRSNGNCPEIYAWGFRNPWRWSFDRVNGDLWVGDVGQGSWEEVNQVTRGGNYGWRCREGAHDFKTSTTPMCATATLIDPVAEYANAGPDVAITGGYVYRGPQSTALAGRYIFSDYGSGIIRAWLSESASQPRQPTQLLNSGLNIASFGEGNDGELYVVAVSTLHRLVFQPPAGGGTAPANLSETGCVAPTDATQPAQGLIPYDINAPFWSDGATKHRWIGLPDGAKITVQSNGDWDFPNRTVLMKNFAVDSRLIETRLFMRHTDGTWAGFTYEWNDQQTDATLVQGGAVRDIGNGQQWIFPSESQCIQCHTNAAGNALGPETSQLNRDITYPQTGRTANQLLTLNHIIALTPPIADPAAQPVMPDPAGTADVASRARAWLHTNCSQCHRPGGPTPSSMDLSYTTAFNQTGTCNALPQLGDLGLGASARLIAPGDATHSLIVNRANRRDANAMPPVGSNQVDAAGVALLTQWINGLTGC